MRGKKAKALRRQAEKVTVGGRERQLVRGPEGNAINHPSSTRALYRAMKKGRADVTD